MAVARPALSSSNAELVARYRDSKYILRGATGVRANAADRLVRLLLHLLVGSLSSSLRVLLGKLFTVYLWLGKPAVTLALFVEEQLLKIVGWLSGTAFSRRDSRVGRWWWWNFGREVHRWQVLSGEGRMVRRVREAPTWSRATVDQSVRCRSTELAA